MKLLPDGVFARTIITGVIGVCISIVLFLAPLLVGRSKFNRYIVACGFILAFLSISCLINAGWDVLRARKK